MTAKAKIRMIVADDHFLVRSGLVASIQADGDIAVVGEASSGAEAIRIYTQCNPGVGLIDLRMPDMSGIEVVQAIRSQFPDARLVVLSAHDGDEDIYRALEAGAMSYVLKSAERDELLLAIRSVSKGDRYIPSKVALRLAERAPLPQLTERELNVLRLVADGRSNKEIGAAMGLVEATVKMHVGNILVKLKVNDRTQAVTKALQRGLLHFD